MTTEERVIIVLLVTPLVLVYGLFLGLTFEYLDRQESDCNQRKRWP